MPFNRLFRKRNSLFFSWDSLTIYDGGSSTSPMIGKYCGNSIPPSYVSSSNEMLIHFQSDWGSAGSITGFKMEYNPLGKQNISIQNKTEYHGDRHRMLVTLFIYRHLYFSYKIEQNCHIADTAHPSSVDFICFGQNHS